MFNWLKRKKQQYTLVELKPEQTLTLPLGAKVGTKYFNNNKFYVLYETKAL